MSSKGPGPSTEERNLQTEQAQQLRQQREILQQALLRQNLLEPFLLESQGLRPIAATTVDNSAQIAALDKQIAALPAAGGGFAQTFLSKQRYALEQQRAALVQEHGTQRIAGFERTPEAIAQAEQEARIRELTLADIEAQAGLAPQEQEIRRLQIERQLAALRGELPVDPALERSLEEGELTLRDRLRAQLGPGFETSTPGIQTLAEFGKRGEELRFSARRAEMTLGEQLRLAGEASGAAGAGAALDVTERLRQSRLGDIFGASQFFLPTAGAFGGSAQGFGGAASLLGQQRLMQQQTAAQERAGYAQAGGTALGAYLGYLALTGSSRAFKTNGVPVDAQAVLDAIKAIPVETWRYRPEFGGTPHVGPYAEDVHAHFGNFVAPNGRVIDLVSMNGVLMAAVQALLTRVEQLEARNV